MGHSQGREIPLYPPIKDLYIELHWTDLGKTTKRFSNVRELADFLKSNPLLAEAVGYVPRKERQELGPRLDLPKNFFRLSPSDQSIWLTTAQDLIVRLKGSVQFDGRSFTSYDLLEKYLEEMKNKR